MAGDVGPCDASAGRPAERVWGGHGPKAWLLGVPFDIRGLHRRTEGGGGAAGRGRAPMSREGGMCVDLGDLGTRAAPAARPRGLGGGLGG
jgi:hypothetical protein